MPHVSNSANKYRGSSVGSGQCVAFVQDAAQAGLTRQWKRGKQVRGATLAIGTAIATFDENGKYINDTHGKSHAAIYLGQTASGIRVLDQWVETKHLADGKVEKHRHAVSERVISFMAKTRPVNDGRNYYVIE